MPQIKAQISLYPMRKQRLSPAIDSVRTVLVGHGLKPKVGPMSTYVVGEQNKLFDALKDAFARTASAGEIVMTITLQNT